VTEEKANLKRCGSVFSRNVHLSASGQCTDITNVWKCPWFYGRICQETCLQ